MEHNPACIICGKELDMSLDNYGWHYGPDKEIERCAFDVLPLKYTTALENINEPMHKRVVYII